MVSTSTPIANEPTTLTIKRGVGKAGPEQMAGCDVDEVARHRAGDAAGGDREQPQRATCRSLRPDPPEVIAVPPTWNASITSGTPSEAVSVPASARTSSSNGNRAWPLIPNPRRTRRVNLPYHQPRVSPRRTSKPSNLLGDPGDRPRVLTSLTVGLSVITAKALEGKSGSWGNVALNTQGEPGQRHLQDGADPRRAACLRAPARGMRDRMWIGSVADAAIEASDVETS